MIGSDGKQIGIVSPQEGITKALEEGLDLVEISPTAKPPVCRILDFGKYLYTLEKEEKQARKKQHIVQIKEIQLSSKIRENDYQTKLRSAIKFLERGHKVKLAMLFRGGEMAHVDLGRKILDRFVEDVSDLAELEKNSEMEGRTIIVHLTPKPSIKKKVKVVEQDHAKTENE